MQTIKSNTENIIGGVHIQASGEAPSGDQRVVMKVDREMLSENNEPPPQDECR